MNYKKNTFLKPNSNKPFQPDSFDLDVYIEKYIWLLIPVLLIVYHIYGIYSEGFYGDDEIGYSMNMKYSFDSINNFIGNSNKPGYRLLFFLPSLLGREIFHISHIFLTSLSVIAVYYLCKELKLKNSIFVTLLFAFQPLVIQFSFRTWPEILTGFFITLAILFYYKKKYLVSSLFSTYLFTIRQEYFIVSIILAFMFILPVLKKLFNMKSNDENDDSLKSYKYLFTRNILPFILSSLGPLIIMILGYISTGNWLFVIKDIKKYGFEIAVARADFWHYFRTFILIVGPITFSLFLVGYFGFIRNLSGISLFFKKNGVLFWVFTIMFIVHILLAWKALNFSGSTGASRFILPLSPLSAVIGGVGLNYILSGSKKTYIYLMLAMILLLTFFFLSNVIDYNKVTSEKDYFNFALAGIFFLASLVLPELKVSSKIYLSLLLILGVGYTIIKEKPLNLDEEYKNWNLVIKEFKNMDYKNSVVFCNHIYFYYSMGIDYGKNPQFRQFDKNALENAPKGSICIWDFHYSNRPEYGSDVPFRYFRNNPEFSGLAAWFNTDNTVFAAIFEKVK